MNELYTITAIFAGLVLFLGLLCDSIQTKLKLAEPLVSVFYGILLGPLFLNAFNIAEVGDPLRILKNCCRFVLAISLFGLALRLPKRYFRSQASSLFMMLGPIMLLMWITSAALIQIFFQLTPVIAFLVAACITPTDPVVASSIVTGSLAKRNLPERLRYLISAESGANDGLAFIFVSLCTSLALHDWQHALTEWMLHAVLWEVGGGIAFGALAGFSIAKMQNWSEDHKLTEHVPLLTVTLASSILVLAVLKLIGCNAVLGVFVAGVAFNNFAREAEEADERAVQEAATRIFTMPCFALFGMMLPWADWLTMSWTAVAVPVIVIALRRLPWIFLFRRQLQPIENADDWRFVGWFGPVGISALLYATHTEPITGIREVWTLTSLFVAWSIIMHGITSVFGAQWYGKRNSPRATRSQQPTATI